MPGSIHVSVLDFGELPSSSLSSSILIRASIGKSDYQTWGKGDFSLPLKTLRDNVNITLLDSEGNELSLAGVNIKSIVDKGSFDESISLEGGGIVRLKLQFVLDERDRNKIRQMRESAMKRKHDELQTGSPWCYKIGSAHGTVASTSRANHEVSDLRASVAQNDVLNVEDQAIWSQEGNEAHMKANTNETNGSDVSKGDQLVNNDNEKEMDQIDVPNASVMKDDSLDKKIETSAEISEGLVEKNAKEMPRNNALNIHVTSKDVSSIPKADLHAPEANKVDEALKNTRSNMRKFNRIYESEDASLVFSLPREVCVSDENLNKIIENIKSNEENQNKLEENNEIKLETINFPKRPISSDDASKDVAAFDLKKHMACQIEKREPLQKTSSNEMRPVIKPPPIKTQTNKVGLDAPEDLDSKDNTKPTKPHLSKVKTPLRDENKLKPVKIDGTKTEERIGNDPSRYASHSEESSALQTQVKETEAITKNEEDLGKTFSVEVRNQNHPRNLLVPEKGVCDTGDAGNPKNEHYHKDSIGKKFENETNTMGSCGHNFSSTETSDAWIFRDEGTHVCLTSEIEQVKDLAGNYGIEERLSPRFLLSETVEKDTRKSGIYPDVNKSGKIKSSNESSPQTEVSPGPFGQAIKIAVMVGFGLLVLLTRQRTPRSGFCSYTKLHTAVNYDILMYWEKIAAIKHEGLRQKAQ